MTRMPGTNSNRIIAHGLTLAALVLSLSAVAMAQDYGFDVWTTANGLPQNTVNGVTQTPDGYL